MARRSPLPHARAPRRASPRPLGSDFWLLELRENTLCYYKPPVGGRGSQQPGTLTQPLDPGAVAGSACVDPTGARARAPQPGGRVASNSKGGRGAGAPPPVSTAPPRMAGGAGLCFPAPRVAGEAPPWAVRRLAS